MTGVTPCSALRMPGSVASSSSTKVGTRPAWKVSTIWTTSLRPGGEPGPGFAAAPALSHAFVGWRRPVGWQPMLGAPPKPVMRFFETVEELPLMSICSDAPMNMSMA